MRLNLYHIQIESVWIPHIIFKNTDTNEAITLETKTKVSITKEGNFTKSGPEFADEVKVILEIFQVRYVILLIYRLKFSKEWRT